MSYDLVKNILCCKLIILFKTRIYIFLNSILNSFKMLGLLITWAPVSWTQRRYMTFSENLHFDILIYWHQKIIGSCAEERKHKTLNYLFMFKCWLNEYYENRINGNMMEEMWEKILFRIFNNYYQNKTIWKTFKNPYPLYLLLLFYLLFIYYLLIIIIG